MYFDETVFTWGESLTEFSRINVFNEVDAYLVAKQGIATGNECTRKTDEHIANLNPRGLCAGINIYSMDARNKMVRKLAKYNQIGIYDGDDSTTPLLVADHQPGAIYSVGLLSGFESAILLKYYAINHSDVFVTRHLHSYVRKYFQDNRSWFNYSSIGIVQNDKKELLLDNEIVNVPILTFASPPIEI